MNINRGEIWLANLDPTVGSEIRKTRPVVIVSNNTNNKHSKGNILDASLEDEMIGRIKSDWRQEE
jgi:hypothetical protein